MNDAKAQIFSTKYRNPVKQTNWYVIQAAQVPANQQLLTC